MIRKPLISLLLLLIISSLACNFATELLQEEPTLAPPPTVGGATVPPATVPEEGTAGPDPTPTLVGDGPQPELGTPPETVTELGSWLGQAHSAEQELADVCSALQSAGWQQPEDSCQGVDLDDDEEEEWLLTLDFSRLQEEQGAAGPLQGHPGDFWVVRAGQVVYQTQDAENPDLFGSAPQVFEVVDMTGDEQPDVITLFTTCGAHTCFNNYQILSAHNGPLQNVISLEEAAEATADEAVEEPIDPAGPKVIGMAYVDEEAVTDVTDDDLPDLVIHGGLIGSAGAGIQRPRTEIWAWDGMAVSLDKIEWEETGYRFHLLYNANYDFDQEAYEVARERYEAVVVDPTLEEVDWPPSAEAVRAAVRQFAGFRLTLLPLFRGDITEATRWRNWLQSEYPDAPLTEAAARLIPEWQGNGNDLVAACATITAYLEQQEDPTGPLTDMGYGNPVLEAEDVCPLE